MKALGKIGQFAVLPVIVILIMFSGVAAQWDHFPTAAEIAPDEALEETQQSLGGFIVRVIMQRRYLFVGYPGYNQQTGQLRSPPTMYDPDTRIGMSYMHYDDDAEDASCKVGLGANQVLIGDGSFVNLPGGYDNDGFEEVHTNIIDMELVDSDGSGAVVRAGIAQGGTLCPGEVQSNFGTGLPGQSFFDVDVIVTLPDIYGAWNNTDMIFYNQYPMFLQNDQVDSLPPIVLYIHQASQAVPVFFLDDNLPFWGRGDLLGHIELAGHGMGYGPDKSTAFWDELDQPENYMPVPPVIPTLSEWGLLVLLALLLGAGIWVTVRRRRRLTVGM